MADAFPDIALHIGAHKTATTHLQRSIRRRAGALAEHGVFFHGPTQLRGPGQGLIERFGLQLPGRMPVPQVDVAAALAELAPHGRRLVLSEENFTGVLLNKTGRIPTPIYPRAQVRIAALARKIAPGGVQVYLGIRNPTSFLSSACGQGLMGGTRVPPDQFRTLNPMINVDWVGLVDRIRTMQEVTSVTVWRYEDYLPMFAGICRALLGAEAGRLIAPIEERVHSGLSTRAAEAIVNGASLRNQDEDIRTTHPVGPGNPPLDAFDAEDHGLSADYYADQIARIDAMPDVTLLRA